MKDFEGLLPSDYGFKPSNKAAPMAGASSAARPSAPSFDLGSRSTRPTSFSGSLAGDADSVFRSHDFGAKSGGPEFDFESMFASNSAAPKRPVISEPVYDKPVYDDEGDGDREVGDIFSGVPGIRSSTSKVKYDDVFASASPPKAGNSSAFDDLLGAFPKSEPRWKSAGPPTAEKPEKILPDFDDLIPGFRATSPPVDRSAPASEANRPSETTSDTGKTASKAMEDPFAFAGQFSDPLEEISKFSNSRNLKTDSAGGGRLFDDVDPFEGLVNPASSFTSERDNRGKETSALRTETNTSRSKSFTSKESYVKSSVRSPDNQTDMKVPVDNGWESHQTLFDMPTAPTDLHNNGGQSMSPPFYTSASFTDLNPHVVRSPSSEENNMESSDDVWLSVSEIPLYTQPTSAPPPSRPPPPRPVSKAGMSSASINARRKNDYSSFPNPSQNFKVPNSTPSASRSSAASPFDELEDFARGRSPNNVDDQVNGISGEELEMNSVAAAMKEAMDRAQAKFRQAKEVRERESTKAARNKEGQLERDEKSMQDERAREKQERLERHRMQREREEEEMEQQRYEKLEREKEREREIEREREEKDREQRRIEKENERAREIEREREKARIAVERATREARERAAVDARQRAERAKAEKAAVDKVTAEARERAERAAVQRAQAEARERAAADAKERAEKAAAEARERANADTKEREARERAATARAEAEARTRAAERAAVGRAAAEARERAAADARERAAAAARANQQKNENDIDSFFRNRASSVPKPRTTSSDPFFDTQFQNRPEPEVARPPSGNSSNIRKASSATNIVDDLSSIFSVAPSTADFQEVEGESDERRRARLERQQRAQERAAKALAEKNQRDLQTQRDQAERHRISETLDVEIKRWAAGKEGNLRALLSTMQYVLWPESGWQPVSLTDMITAASVKKAYRKATLCIHPDKVQQKGANLQQKYVAEKVFDLLKEAWNKFNSEELF